MMKSTTVSTYTRVKFEEFKNMEKMRLENSNSSNIKAERGRGFSRLSKLYLYLLTATIC
jgi:hypothetical protein